MDEVGGAIKKDSLRNIVSLALDEDLGPEHLDATTDSLHLDQCVVAQLSTRESCRVAGLDVVKTVFEMVDNQLDVKLFSQNGSDASKGEVLMEVSGSASSILKAERTALNFAQRLCGIATLTRSFVDRVGLDGPIILDTRKTTPGLRELEKAAVVCGGGYNHRMGLYDAVMIKDNHLAYWGNRSISDAIKTARKRFPNLKIQVEVDTIDQLKDAVLAKPDWVLLDNMSVNELREAVSICQGVCKVEASGGITLDEVANIASTCVDAISIGALTHSVFSIDLSLDVNI